MLEMAFVLWNNMINSKRILIYVCYKIVIPLLFTMKNSFIFAGAFAAIFLIAAMASGIVSLINAQNSAFSLTTGSAGGNST
jgi:hypothetical protein